MVSTTTTDFSVLDLAVKGTSFTFVEQCCQEAIECRWYGDIDPHLNIWWCMLLAIFSFGLLPLCFPNFIRFTPPPRTEATRRRTQRRIRPQGYPFRPSVNKVLSALKKEISDEADQPASWSWILGLDSMRERHRLKKCLLVDDSRVHSYSDADLEVLWDGTFGPYHRWECFITAPIVIFWYNVVITALVTFFFLGFFVADRVEISLELDRAETAGSVVKASLELDTIDDGLTAFEPILWVYFAASIVRECSQISVEVLQRGSFRKGILSYAFDYWNFFDLLGIITFIFGYHWRHFCGAPGCKSFGLTVPPATDFADWSLSYALCIWCLCFRVLRVFYVSPMGQIVSIFFAMLVDVTKFIFVYVIAILGMAVLYVGVADPSNLVKFDCSPTEGSDIFMSCKSGFFLTRTLFQSFGEFFEFDGVTNDFSMVLLLVTFFLTNILLMNLLIAMMANTYESKIAIAHRDRLVDRYELVEEHARCAFAIPVPFNVVILVVEAVAFLLMYDSVQKKHPECSFFERWDLFVSRNRSSSLSISHNSLSLSLSLSLFVSLGGETDDWK